MQATVKCICGCTHILESGGKVEATLLTKKCFKCGEKVTFKAELLEREDTVEKAKSNPVPEKKHRGRAKRM